MNFLDCCYLKAGKKYKLILYQAYGKGLVNPKKRVPAQLSDI